jgi:probable HAF family extracellular repeat protein
MRWLASLSVLAVVVVAVLAGSARPAGSGLPSWVATDLGTLPGKTRSVAIALNERGQIIGNAGSPCPKATSPPPDCLKAPRAFLWQNARMVALGTLGGKTSSAQAINSRGQIVGSSTTARGTSHAFLWQSGRMRDLGTLGGKQSSALDINDNGQVIGSSTTASGALHGFLWQKGRMVDIGTLGGTESRADAINNRGQIVGSSTVAPGPDPNNPSEDPDPGPSMHPFLWQNGRKIDLGSLPGRPVSVGVAINDRGDITGVASWRASTGNAAMNPEYKAFLWHNGKLIALPDFGLDDYVDVWAINDLRQVVGTCAVESDGGTLFHPVLWSNGRIIDLSPRDQTGATLFDGKALSINARGQVAGNGRSFDSDSGIGSQRAYVWDKRRPIQLEALGGVEVALESSAAAINERGQVVGWATTTNGKKHAVLWTLRSN